MSHIVQCKIDVIHHSLDRFGGFCLISPNEPREKFTNHLKNCGVLAVKRLASADKR